MKENNFLKDVVYPKIDKMILLRDLNPKTCGNYISLTCPECKHHEAYIWIDGEVIICNRKNGCRKNTHIFRYIKESQEFTTNFEVTKYLAEHANVQLPELNSEQMKRIESHQKKINLLECIQDFFVKSLWSPAGKEHLEYLRNERKYTDDDIRNMGLGYFPGFNETAQHLLSPGHNIDVIEREIESTLEFIKSRDTHQLTIPYRDCKGNLINIYGRLNHTSEEKTKSEGSGTSSKYMPYGKASKASPFNMYNVRGQKEIVIVEGYLDTLLANAKGIDNVIGIGGSTITHDQFNMIVESKPERILLCLDNDKAGIDGTINAIKRFNEKSIEVLIVVLPTGFKDPDELISKLGIEQFKIAVACSKSCGKWLASNIIEDPANDIATDVGRRKAINEAIKWFKILKDPLDQKDLRNSVSSALSIPDEKWQEVIDKAKKQELEQQEKTMLSTYNEKIQQFSSNGDTEGTKQEILRCAQEIKKQRIVQDQSFQQYLKNSTEEDLLDSFKKMIPGIDTGYTIGEKELILPGGAITILAGQTGHGKTTVLQNLALGAIKRNENLSVYYFSFEESAPFILAQFLNIWMNEELNKGNNRNAIIHYFHAKAIGLCNPLQYIKYDKGSIFEEKKDFFFNNIINKGRLKIFDPELYAEDLVALIPYLKENTNVGLIIIDYVQLLRLQEKPSGMSRHEELKEICKLLHSCSVETGLPILMAAQFNRKVENEETMSLLEIADSVDIARFGNVCIGIWNRNYNQGEDDNDKSESEIFFKVLKGRYIGIGHNSAIPFNGNTGHIGDLRFCPAVQAEATILSDELIQQQQSFTTF